MKGSIFSSKLTTFILCIIDVLLLYAIIGFVIIPAVLSSQIPKIAKEELNREVQIENIQFNPFSMEIDLQGFEMSNLDPTRFISFDRFYLNIGVLKSISDLTVTLDSVELDKPFALIDRNKQGNFNFTDLLKGEEEPKPEEEPSEGIFPVKISQIKIAEGKIDWKDNFYSTPQQESVSPLNLTINDFTTLVDEQSQMGISLALLSGGTLEWKGEIELTPFSSKGQVSLNQINFKKVWELFLQDSVNFEILKGSELIAMYYTLTESEKGMQLLIDNANIEVVDLQLAEKGKTESVIDIPNFKVEGIAVNLLDQNIVVTQVSAKDAKFKALLSKEGVISYQTLFASNEEPTAKNVPQQSPVAEETDSPWKVSIKQFSIDDFSFHLTDQSLSPPSPIKLTKINLKATDITTQPDAELPFQFGLVVNKEGELKINGKTKLSPFSSQLNVNVKNLALPDFQPYVDTFARLDIITGLFNVDLDISMLQEDNKPFQLNLQGNSHINNLVTRDQKANKDFLKWKQLSLNKIDVDLAANKYLIDSVEIDKLFSRVLIRKDKSINVSDIVKESESKEEVAEEKQTSEKEASPTTFKISQFKIKNGELDFSDQSLILPFSAHINRLNGTVKGISSAPDAIINIAMNGQVANLAPVNIKGKINTKNDDSNFDLNFKSMPLPLMTPYMAEFAGRKIEKGNMSLNLKYKIANKKLEASNSLLIDRLELGDEVDNPEAVSLPLGLAIALLEDSEGKIKLDMPISGSIDDPQFSVGSLIFDTLVNVLTKIIASPFNAIASLVDTEGDISKVIFSPGKAVLNQEEQKKLEGLAKALLERPALKLEVKGSAFTDQDWPQLRLEALNNKLLKIRADELSKEENKTVLVEHLTPSEEENQRLLADMFIKEFPELAERSMFGTPRLIDPTQGDFYTVAQTKLAATIKPDPQRLEQLAVSRAQVITKFLVKKEITVDRLFLLNIDIDPEDSENIIATSLNLTTN